MVWLQENLVLILSVLLGVSEALALVPALKSNSILTLITNVLKSLLPKKE